MKNSTTDNNRLFTCILRGRVAGEILLLCLTFFSLRGSAQTPADSLTLCSTPWKTVLSKEGLSIEQTQLRLFNSDQELSRIILDPTRFRLAVAQQKKRQTVKHLGKETAASGAINGSFFVTKTNKAQAVGLVKSNGKLLSSVPGWCDAAIAIDSTGNLHFIFSISKLKQRDTLWHHSYNEMMEVGPALCKGGKALIERSEADTKRHPRSLIGQQRDGKIVLMVVDGRQKGADGMTLSELAYICRILGLTEALNLDGGGSSTLWNPTTGILNRPSDHVGFIRVPRRVCNALILQPR